MKKNVFLGILALVTICAIIFGSFYHMGGSLFDVPFFRFSTKRSADMENLREVGEFEAIEAAVDVADMTLTTGRDYAVSYKGPKRLRPSIRVEEGVLYIEQRSTKRWFGFSWGGRTSGSILITIPEGAELDRAGLDLRVGDIQAENIQARELTIKANVGDMTLDSVRVGSGELESNVGDIEVLSGDFTDMTIESDVGDVSVEDVRDLDKMELDLSSSLGDLDLDIGGNSTSVEHDGGVGAHYKQAGDGEGSLKVRSRVGDVSIESDDF